MLKTLLGETSNSIDNVYDEIASEEESALKKQEIAERAEAGLEVTTASPIIPAAVVEPVDVPEAPLPGEVLEPESGPLPGQLEISAEVNGEYAATSIEPEGGQATLIDSYEGHYHQEPTPAPIPSAPGYAVRI